MGLLTRECHERWRRGSVPYLERVILCDLSRASYFLHILRLHTHDFNLKPSLTIYKHRSQTLRFTKFGDRNLEEAYSRHFVVVGAKNPTPPICKVAADCIRHNRTKSMAWRMQSAATLHYMSSDPVTSL